MSYSSKHRHLSRREKYKRNTRIIKIFVVFLIIALAVLIYKNRVYLYDVIRTSFY